MSHVASLPSRWVRWDAFGILFWCVAIGIFSVPWWVDLFTGSASPLEAKLRWLGLGTPFALASALAFVIAAVRSPATQGRNSGGAVLSLFTVIIALAVSVTIHKFEERQYRQAGTTQMLVDLNRVAEDVEAIRSRLGRLPQDELELVRLRKEPMPRAEPYYRIAYATDRDGGYCLTCGPRDFWGGHWDLFGYIVLFYGPKSPQRIRVELF